MYADLDELVLSGKLFNGTSRSSSPVRTPSPDHSPARDWPGQNEKGGEDYEDYSSDAERQARIDKIISAAPQDAPNESIGMGPGRTGVKGVIRDRAEAQAMARDKRNREVRELNRKMEKASLGGKTFLEEERERELEKMMLEGLPTSTEAGASPAPDFHSRGVAANGSGKARFGHLREVDVNNFVSAVEKEARSVWVVVHLYDSSLDRCYTLDNSLSRLARSNPDTKFLRARASALGFASSSSSSRPISSSAPHTNNGRSTRSSRIVEEDEDDPYAYDGKEKFEDDDGEENENDGGEEGEVDLDVLPTLLAYRNGELVHTWVRVDWEAGDAGVDELLAKHHILGGAIGPGNCGLPSDDEDLWDSD